MPKNIFSLLDQVRSLSLEGLSYAKNEYDIERYKKLLKIVAEQYSNIWAISSEEVTRILKKETGCITPKIGIDVAILSEDAEMLILKRSDDQTWSLPCGWMDVGEKPLETAIRETREEAGINIKPLGYIAVTTKGPDNYPGQIVYHQINILVVSRVLKKDTEIKLSSEHSEYNWIKPSDNIKWHAGHETLVEPIKNFLKNGIYIP